MQVHNAENTTGFINYNNGRDFLFLHQIQSLAGQNLWPNGLRIARHALPGSHLERCAAMLFHEPPEIAVGDDSASRPSACSTVVMPRPFLLIS